MSVEHINDVDLERYYFGLVNESELTAITDHLLSCHFCRDRARETERQVDAIRAAARQGCIDLK